MASSAWADDWPQWRGPLRDGVWRESGIVETFPADGVKIVWRAPIGAGWASPVVAEGRVFVADSELMQPKARERVRCFDAASGKVLWTELIRVRFTLAGYEEISRTRLIEPVMPFGGRKLTWSPPAYARRHVFVRDEREVVCASLAVDGR